MFSDPLAAGSTFTMGRRIWLLCWLLLLPLSIWSGWERAGGARWQIAMASIPVAGVGGTGENKVAKGTKSFECFCSGQLLESQVVNSGNISIMQSLSCLQSTTPCQKQWVGRLNSWRWSLRGYFLSEEEDLRLEKFGWYSEGACQILLRESGLQGGVHPYATWKKNQKIRTIPMTHKSQNQAFCSRWRSAESRQCSHLLPKINDHRAHCCSFDKIAGSHNF